MNIQGVCRVEGGLNFMNMDSCQTPILAKSKRLGVDFVFAPSQESQSQSQESQPHRNPVVPGKVED